VLKGIPLTYNRDLQEDKEAGFDAADHWRNALGVMARAVASIEVDAGACLYAASAPELLATDAADALVREGLPFRKAHQVVGAAVRKAEEKGTRIDRLEEKDWEGISERQWNAVSGVLHGHSPAARLRKALQSRQAVVGAPSPNLVEAELRRWSKALR